MREKENKSLFLQYFGDAPKLRVMDFLIDNLMFDFPVTEVARGSNVSYNSLMDFLKDWIEKGIIVKTRRIGKSDYYKLNLKNNFVSNLVKLDWAIATKEMEKEISA